MKEGQHSNGVKPAVLNIGQNYRVTGGSDRYMLNLGRLLEGSGLEVVPFCASDPRNLETPWSKFFPPAISMSQPRLRDVANFIYSPRAAASLKALLAYKAAAVAHLHIYYGQLTSSILEPLSASGVPIVQTLHEYKIVCPTYTLNSHGRFCQDCDGRHYWKAIVNRCNRGSVARSAVSALESYVSRANGALSKVSHFLAVSDFLREKVIELGVPASKVTTVHNFIDTGGIDKNYAQGEYFLYFGRIERIKGVFTLLDAIAPLKHCRLVIAGAGNDSEELRRRIEAESLNHVSYVGFKSGEELAKLIRGCIATISPSEWYETFGLTLIESHAHCRPVIASAIGGMTEVVHDGVDGLLTKPGDSQSIRAAIEALVESPRRAVEWGLAGRSKVEDKFSPQKHLQEVLSVYRAAGANL